MPQLQLSGVDVVHDIIPKGIPSLRILRQPWLLAAPESLSYRPISFNAQFPAVYGLRYHVTDLGFQNFGKSP